MTLYPGGAFSRDLLSTGVTLNCLHKGGRWDLRFLLELLKGVRVFRPDVVYSFLTTANVFNAVVKCRFPKTRCIWGIRASNMELSRYGRFQQSEFQLSRWLSRLSDAMVFNSHAGAEHVFAAGFSSVQWRVIPNGIDTAVYRPDAGSGRPIRSEWGVADHHTLVGLVGRYDEMKDHGTFIRAAARVARVRPDARFVCVGGGDEGIRRRIARQIASEGLDGRVLLAGFTKEMPRVYNALDLLCSSSAFGEGFSNVIGEAMACGVPCVATNVGDAARIIGDTGVIVPPQNDRLLAEGILDMLERIGCQRGCTEQRAAARIRRLYTIERMVARTEGFMAETTAPRHAGRARR